MPFIWRSASDHDCFSKTRQSFPRTPTRESIAKGLTRTAFSDISVGDKVHFALPSNVEIFDRVQFRLALKFAGVPTGRAIRVRMLCFDDLPEIKRWTLRPIMGRSRRLKGVIDGTLIIARGIDQLWMSVTARGAQNLTVSGTFQAKLARGSSGSIVHRIGRAVGLWGRT